MSTEHYLGMLVDKKVKKLASLYSPGKYEIYHMILPKELMDALRNENPTVWGGTHQRFRGITVSQKNNGSDTVTFLTRKLEPKPEVPDSSSLIAGFNTRYVREIHKAREAGCRDALRYMARFVSDLPNGCPPVETIRREISQLLIMSERAGGFWGTAIPRQSTVTKGCSCSDCRRGDPA